MINLPLPQWLSDRDQLVGIIIWIALFTFYLPGKAGSIMFIAALICLVIYRRQLRVPRPVLIAGAVFFAYLLLFVLMSTNHGRSAKGAYDMLRGGSVYFIGYYLFQHLQTRANLFYVVIACAIIAGNLFFPRDWFYSYFENPNSAAVQLVAACSFLSLLVVLAKSAATRWLSIAGLVLGLSLIVVTNSRSVWLGLSAGTVFFFVTWTRIRLLYRILVPALVGLFFGVLIMLMNFKGFSLRGREEIWLGLSELTFNNSPWIGHGINMTKDVMVQQMQSTSIIAHNIFLETFSDSGFLGLFIILALFVYLFKVLYRDLSVDSLSYNLCLAVIVCFLSIGQFDLKFASFNYIAIIAFFIGAICSMQPQKEGVS